MATTVVPPAGMARPRKIVSPSVVPVLFSVAILVASIGCALLATFSETIVVDVVGYLLTFGVVMCPALQRHLDARLAETARLLPDAVASRMRLLMIIAGIAVLVAMVHGWRIATWVALQWFV